MTVIANPLDSKNPLPAKAIVIVGMPGAGKSSIGRRLAARLGLRFVDSDDEVEKAANMSIAQIFEEFGEPEFRAGECRVVRRLLNEGALVLSTGGGTYMSEEVRSLINEHGISVWLRADIEILYRRISRRTDRPLLKGPGDEPRHKLEKLFEIRQPIFQSADVIVDTDERPVDQTVEQVLKALGSFAAKVGDAL